MNIKTAIILSSIFAVTLCIADEENTLLGQWEKVGEPDKEFIVTFEADKMSLSTGASGAVSQVQTTAVRYVELDGAWGIELLSDTGEAQAAMMAIIKDESTIEFGAPGSVFFEMHRIE